MSVNIETPKPGRRDLPRGVYRRPRGPRPFVAYVSIADRLVYLGSFTTVAAANAAVKAAIASREALPAPKDQAEKDAAAWIAKMSARLGDPAKGLKAARGLLAIAQAEQLGALTRTTLPDGSAIIDADIDRAAALGVDLSFMVAE